MAFRGVGKSWITAAFVVWVLWNDSSLNILVVSASKDRSDAFSTFVKRIIYEWPLVHVLIPRQGQRDSNENFDVGPAPASQAPSVKSVGITGQITGTRADLVIFDDVEVPKNVETITAREKLSERVKEAAAVLKPEGPKVVLYLGTPQLEDSLYTKLSKRGYYIRIWPARYPNDKLLETYQRLGGELGPVLQRDMQNRGAKVGSTTDPDRFNELELKERELEYGRSGFALQFQLDTSLSDADRYPLKLRDLVVMDLDKEVAPNKVVWSGGPEQHLPDLPVVGLTGDRWQGRMVAYAQDGKEVGGWGEYQGSLMSIDPAGRGKDELAYTITKMLHGQIFLLKAGGFRQGYEQQTLVKLAKMARDYSVQDFVIESNFGDGMWTRLFMPVLNKYHKASLDPEENEVRHSSQKEVRIIDTLEPVMNAHRLIVGKDVVLDDWENVDEADHEYHLRRLFYQLTRLTRDRGALKYDDRLDALAIAVAYWIEHMDRDVDQQVAAHNEALLDEELESFLEGITGRAKHKGWLAEFGADDR